MSNYSFNLQDIKMWISRLFKAAQWPESTFLKLMQAITAPALSNKLINPELT
jgi:hypothetical protein